jgi:hypothetical protein
MINYVNFFIGLGSNMGNNPEIQNITHVETVYNHNKQLINTDNRY